MGESTEGAVGIGEIVSTITSRETIKTIVNNEGIYPGDPQVDFVFEYTNTHNREVMWKIIYGESVFEKIIEFLSSPYCRQIDLLWSSKYGKQRDPS